MQILKTATTLVILVLAGGCSFVPGHSSSSSTTYQPNADGPAAMVGAVAVIPALHLAYASNQTGAPGAFGSGVARFNGLSLEAFSMDGDLSDIPPANAQAGFFLRSTTTLTGHVPFHGWRFVGGLGGALSDTVYGDADALIAWGRWSDTTARLITRSNVVPLGEFHYVIGQLTPVARLPQPSQPTLARYHAVGGIDTLSTALMTQFRGGSAIIPRTSNDLPLSGFDGTSSSLSVLWGSSPTPKIGLDIRWQATYGFREEVRFTTLLARLTTTGGADDPSASQLSLRSGMATFGGSGIPFMSFSTVAGFEACQVSGVCQSTVEGFFAGPDAERAGASFQVSDGSNALLSGAWAFGADAPPPAAPVAAAPLAPLDPAGPFAMVRAGGPADIPASLNPLGVMTQNQTTGALDRFGQAPFTNELARGTAQSADVGGDALITWGRWTNGSYDRVQSFGNAPVALGAEQALHYVIGALTPNAGIPASGTAAFSLMGATKPTFGDGALAAGTLTGSMRVSWGGSSSTKVGMDLTVTMPGDASYSIVSAGGLASPSLSQVQTFFNAQFTGTVPVTSAGRACASNPGGCGANIAGLFAGPAAERAGIAYQIGSGNAQQGIYGAAAFKKQ